jgi:hypothetical protein
LQLHFIECPCGFVSNEVPWIDVVAQLLNFFIQFDVKQQQRDETLTIHDSREMWQRKTKEEKSGPSRDGKIFRIIKINGFKA